jgi:hypothetical protein
MLRIKTFSEQGVSCFFKALGHLEIQPKLQALIQILKSGKKIAIYDPENRAEEFFDLTNLSEKLFTTIYVQKLEFADKNYNGKAVKLISEIKQDNIEILLIIAFDAQRYHDHIKHLLKPDWQVLTLDQLKLPEHMVTKKDQYLNPLNWATNFIWFKEQHATHTRLVTANYWVKYGGKDVVAYMYLLNAQGQILAHWHEALNNKVELFILDSKEVKNKFNLPEFMGQVFIHMVGASGHDVVKYALDIYGDDDKVLSATHDANAWPCNYFAGLPAPKQNEKVYVWLQNTHPVAIKPGTISLNLMGEENHQYIKQEILPYGSLQVDTHEYFPNVNFPAQFEINAGNYFVRPRYEVENLANKRKCIAHVNVERDNLAVDPKIKEVTKFIGKGFILPAPILPINEYTSQVLPTPMARSLKHLPLKAIVYSSEGKELAIHKFGNLTRNHKQYLAIDELVKDIEFFKVAGNFGNLQIVYDFEVGSDADGWIHGIFKYSNKNTSHMAETSFGSHIFNNITTYKSEPQSYKGPPPGLSTSLFLRVGPSEVNSLCYLIYPVSNSWHSTSQTVITLLDNGNEVATYDIKIAANGCYLVDCNKIFGHKVIADLKKPYVIITDRTCRLFGYHLLVGKEAFSMDHMFGF